MRIPTTPSKVMLLVGVFDIRFPQDYFSTAGHAPNEPAFGVNHPSRGATDAVSTRTVWAVTKGRTEVRDLHDGNNLGMNHGARSIASCVRNAQQNQQR